MIYDMLVQCADGGEVTFSVEAVSAMEATVKSQQEAIARGYSPVYARLLGVAIPKPAEGGDT